MKMKNTIKVIIFVILFLFLFQRLSLFVQVYGTDKADVDRRACLFFSLPKNTVDVMFLGNSHIYCSYIPQQMFDEYGISAAMLSTSSQSYQNSYWLLKEALKKQNPKVVVMDIHSVVSSVDEEVEEFRLHYTSGISAMPDLCINKALAYWDIASGSHGWAPSMTIYDSYGILEYKNEYERKQNDWMEAIQILWNPVRGYQTLGFFPTDTIYPIEELSPGVRSDYYVDFQTTEEYKYLCKIWELLKKNNIDLIMARAPYVSDLDTAHLDEQALEWCHSENIPVIDFFQYEDKISLNLQTDFRDADHLNYWGARKATSFMEQYLLSHYELADHRGQARYYPWEYRKYDYSIIHENLVLAQKSGTR